MELQILDHGEHLGIRWQIKNLNWSYPYIHYVFSNIRQSNFSMSGRYEETLYILNENPSLNFVLTKLSE